MRTIRRLFVGAAVVSVTIAAARGADAAGFAAARFGGEHGNVVDTNPTALYYNPGAIGFSEGIHLYLGGDIAMRHATWTHTAPDDPNLSPNSNVGNSGTARLFNVFAGPTLAATAKLGNFAFGAGLFVPFAGRVNWSKNSAFQQNFGSDVNCTNDAACPLAADGVQRWHMIDAEITVISVTAGAAYRLGPVSVGGTFNFYNSTITESQSHTFSSQVDATAENTAKLNVTGNNASFGLGAMIAIIPDMLTIGGSYQFKPGLIGGGPNGEQQLKGSLAYIQGPAPYYAQTGSTSYGAIFHQTLPDIARAGIKFRPIDALEFRAFGDLTRWSSLTSQCVNNELAGTGCQVYPSGANVKGQTILQNIPRNWKDTWGGRFGVSYYASPTVEIFAGAGYETGAAPDATMEPGAMDGDNIAGALGGRFFIADSFYLSGSYTHLQFMDRNVTTSTLATNAKGVPVAVPTLGQDGNGAYTQWIGIFDVNIEKQF